MVNVQYTTANGRLRFTFEVETAKAAFASVAALQEVFEEPACGQCQSERIRFDVREKDGNKYHKLVCLDCGAQLDFGQFRNGSGLFVKRADKDKHPIGKRGWYHWQSSQSAPVGDDGVF